MSFKKYGRDFLKGFLSYRVTSEQNSEAIESFLTSLDCARSLTVLMLFRNGEHEQLAKLECDPLHYSNAMEFRDAYAATKFLSKYKDLTLDYDLDEVALEKFDSFEALCKQTNSRFRALSSDPLYKGRTVRLHHAVVRKINKILGEFCSEEFFSMPDWGPGATTLIKRRFASPANKFQLETGITRDLHSLVPLDLLRSTYPGWADHLSGIGFPQYQIGNKVVTVPKDATTNRVIAIEPGINLWFQLSLGEMIGRRLRRCGIDLRYQSRNQQLARIGSISGQLATVDLSSASDSISKKVVEELFSYENSSRWLQVMEACRSHFGTQNNSKPKLWEKFSSMGNGFTFPLESLIFYAVSYCCAEYLHADTTCVSVYGDDIILPTTCFEVFSEMMDFYGFRVNLRKSHFDSPFRESCGAHHYSGLDVKPVYFKDRLSSVPSVYRLANAVRRLAHRRNSTLGCDAALRVTFDRLVQMVPKALRLRVPEGYGDGGFVSNFDEATPSRARHGVEGYHVIHAVEVSKTYQEDRYGYLLAALWQMPSYDLVIDREARLTPKALEALTLEKLRKGSDLVREIKSKGRNSVPLRGLTKIQISSKGVVQQWPNLGPWL